MSQKTLITALLLIVFFAHFKIASAQSKITGIQARLFYNQKSDMNTSPTDNVSGTFSKSDIINDKSVALWNTIIGEGSAEGPSTQTVVIVTIRSLNYSNKLQKLKFTVLAGTKVISQETRQFDVIGKTVDYKLLFLLNDTGCGKLTIRSELFNSGKVVSVMTKSIDFECGE